MAQINQTTWGNELLNIYTREKLFEPMERTATPLLNLIQEADDIEPGGAGLKFRMITHGAHRVGTPGDGADLPGGGVRQTLQGSVSGVQIASSFEVSEKALNAGKGEGSFAGDILHDAIVEATQNLYSHQERLLVVSHGTGRLAQVESTVVGSTTWTAKLPQHVFGLKPGMTIDFVDLDSGGAVQVSAAVISDVDDPTRVVTMTAAVSVTANWSVYISGYYGSAPFGFRGIIDNASFMTSFFGQSRASNPRLNAVVDANAGTPRPWEEKIIRRIIHRIERETGLTPSFLMCNQGVVSEHLEKTIPDRQYQVSGKDVPAYGIGYDPGNLFFQYKGNKIPYKIVMDMPARECLVVTLKTFRKHTLRKAGWIGGNDPSSLLHLTPSTNGGNYRLSYIGGFMTDMNISCRNAIGNGAARDFRDNELAGDA